MVEFIWVGGQPLVIEVLFWTLLNIRIPEVQTAVSKKMRLTLGVKRFGKGCQILFNRISETSKFKKQKLRNDVNAIYLLSSQYYPCRSLVASGDYSATNSSTLSPTFGLLPRAIAFVLMPYEIRIRLI